MLKKLISSIILIPTLVTATEQQHVVSCSLAFATGRIRQLPSLNNEKIHTPIRLTNSFSHNEAFLVSGGRLGGGEYILGSFEGKSGAGGATRAVLLIDGLEIPVVEKIYDVSNGELFVELHLLAHQNRLSPEFYGFIDVVGQEGQAVKLLYNREMGAGEDRLTLESGQPFVLKMGDLNQLLTGRYSASLPKNFSYENNITPYLNDIVAADNRLKRYHADYFSENILIEFVRSDSGEFKPVVLGIDWGHPNKLTAAFAARKKLRERLTRPIQ